MTNVNDWCSVTASVNRETRDSLAMCAAARGTTVASLIKKALKIYLAEEVKAAAVASQLTEEQTILRALAEYKRNQSESATLSLVDHITKMEFYVARLIFLATGRNEELLRRISEQAGKHVTERRAARVENSSKVHV